MINLLFIGDVVGFPGLDFIKQKLPCLVEKYNSNFIIVNGENICDGKGITETEADQLFDLGVDVITTGNHIWDNWMSKPLLKTSPRVIRPLNYPSGNVGRGYVIVNHKNTNKEIAVLQIQGRMFMQTIDCPFRAADAALEDISKKTEVIIVDFHADATSEKVSMGWYLDGRVSALLGTHTHIQTADEQILPKGTAYITDVGMSGPYDSVLGLDKTVAIKRYLYQTAHKFIPATKDIHICGVSVQIDSSSGQAVKIERIIYPDFDREALNFNYNSI